jgi:single-stranded DNA-binding protein
MLGQADAHIMGFLSTDPLLIGTSTNPVCRMRIGVERSYKDKRYVEYYNVVAFKDRAIFYKEHLVKGDMVLVSGSLRTNKREIGSLYYDEVQLQVRELIFLSNLKDYSNDKEIARQTEEDLVNEIREEKEVALRAPSRSGKEDSKQEELNEL